MDEAFSRLLSHYGISTGADPGVSAGDLAVDLKNRIIARITRGSRAIVDDAVKLEDGESHEVATDGFDYVEEAQAGASLISEVKQLSTCLSDLEVLEFLISCGGE